jgi:hypothetical protein
MEGQRFDTFSRNLAHATDRRTVVRGAAGGGFFAMLGLLFGRKQGAAAKEQPVTCSWEIEAHGSVGPNETKGYNGILTVTIQPDGGIDAGTYVLVDDAWKPLVDSGGHPISFDVVGSSYLRSIDFRVEHDGCDELDFRGVNRFHVRDCKGPMSGSFHGPELVDLGGWRTRQTETCSACRGMTCPPKSYLDSDKCQCIPQCPGTSVVCQDVVCVPAQCPNGTVYDADRCVCACAPQTCKPTEVWCPYSCQCIPPTPCKDFTCPPGYVHALLGDGICVCVKNPCGKDIVCPAGEILIFNGEECKCVGDCKKSTCDKGYTWDDKVCGCVGGCIEKDCPDGEMWDKATCSCVNPCRKQDCQPGYVWDDAHCNCQPQGCPPIQCPNDNYVVDPKTCQCTCVEQTCSGNYVWSPNSCLCYCPDLTCPQGTNVNSDTCTCEPGPCVAQQCAANFAWSYDTCACVCTLTGCDPGYELDKGKCVCNPGPCVAQQCSTNYAWSYDTCSCVCTLTSCDPGYQLDKAKCVCNPIDPCATAPACDPGLVMDKQTCQCHCPDGGDICGAGCNDTASTNCGSCGNTCSHGCCGGFCCLT